MNKYAFWWLNVLLFDFKAFSNLFPSQSLHIPLVLNFIFILLMTLSYPRPWNLISSLIICAVIVLYLQTMCQLWRQCANRGSREEGEVEGWRVNSEVAGNWYYIRYDQQGTAWTVIQLYTANPQYLWKWL